MSKIPGMFSVDVDRDTADLNREDAEDPIQGTPSYLSGEKEFGFGLNTGVSQFRASGARVSPAARSDDPQLASKKVNFNKLLFNDIHCHMADYSGRMHELRNVIDAADVNGIGRWTMMPIPTMVVSKMGDQLRLKQYDKAHHCGETYYIPEDWCTKGDSLELDRDALIAISLLHELRVDGDVDTNLLTEINRAVIDQKITPREMGRMDLGMTGLHLGDPSVTKSILKKLITMKTLNDGLRGTASVKNIELDGNRLRYSLIGEVTLRKELVEELFAGETQAHLEENITPTREAMRLAGEIGLPWLLHCDIDHMKITKDELAKTGLPSSSSKVESPRHLESIKKLFRACPNTDIIWAHAGGLGRFVKASSNHTDHLEELFNDKTLSHVKIDISWSHVAKQLVGKSENSDPKIKEEICKKWAEFFVKHSDRILFGSDTLTPKNNAAWMETFHEYSPSLFNAVKELEFTQMQKDGKILEGVTSAKDITNEKSETLSKILFKNYADLMDKSRKRIDFFTDHVLLEIVPGASYIGGPDTVDVQAIANKRVDILNRAISDLKSQINDTKDDKKIQVQMEILGELESVGKLFRVSEETLSSSVSNASEKSFGSDRLVDAQLLSVAFEKKQIALNVKIQKGINSLEKHRNKLELRRANLYRISTQEPTQEAIKAYDRNQGLINHLNHAIADLNNLMGRPKTNRRASIG